MKRRLIAVSVVLAICSAAVLAQVPSPGKNPILGMWKLNLEMSKFTSGPPPKSQTRQYTEREGGFIVASIWKINAQGNPTFTQTVSKYDGKEYDQYNQTTLATFQASGTKTGNTQSFKVIDAYTVDITNKQDGRIASTVTRTVSPDGKTMTTVVKGTNAQGKSYTDTLVFDRQ